MAQYIYPFITAIYSSIGFSIVGAPLKQNKLRYLIFIFFMYFLTIGLSFVLKDYFRSSVELVVGIVGFILMYSLIFKTHVLKSISYFAIIYLVGMISETIFIIILTIFGLDTEIMINNVYINLIVHFFNLFIISLCIYIKPLKSLLKRISEYSFAIILILVNLVIFVLMLREVIDYISNERTAGLNTMIVFTMIILITGVIALYFYLKREKEISAIKKYIELREEISPLIDYSIKQQHDFNNHLLTLRTLFDSENHEGVKYIDTLYEELQSNNEYLNWCSPILGALIQRKKHEARQLNIDFIPRANSRDDLFPVKDHELISIISNLLDNAFTATSKLSEENRKVEMIIGKTDKVFVSVKNTCIIDNVKIENIFKRGYTTKNGSRGLGLNIVKSISNKYNGEINVFPSDKGLEIKVSFDIT